MPARTTGDAEPAPLAGAVSFEEGDFHALSSACAADPQYNDRRLVTRRKLAALGRSAVELAAADGVALEARTSLHNPTVFNHMRVKRMWAYLCRGKKEKKRLRALLGPELGKDLDSAFRNAYLCLAVEADGLEVSLRLRSEGWYDGQNLVNRVGREGPREWLRLLNELRGFRLRLHDWKGEWVCGGLSVERLEEFLGYYKPGEHALTVESRLPAPPGDRGAALGPDAPQGMLAEVRRLLPLYRFTAWSEESDFLFGG